MPTTGISGELQQGLDALRAMLEAGGDRAADDTQLMLAYAGETEADAARQQRFGEIASAALRGFFHLAGVGHAFVSLARYREEFDGSLGQNYPGAGAGFLRLATSYWTLNMLQGRLSTRYAGICLQQVLLYVERQVGRAFFPDSAELDSAALAQLQRRLISESGAPIDIDQFMLGNPMLVGNPLAG